VRIAPGDEATVRFRVRVGAALGAQPILVRAASGAWTAQRRIELSLRPATAAREDLRAGRADQRIVLGKLRTMYEPQATRRLAASPSPLVAIDGLAAYLADYPHYCTEQLVSQAMPALVYATRPELGHPVVGKVDAAKLIDVLRARQNSEGGLGLWSATPDADPFVTGYAALYLVEARERGVAVPADLLDALDGYLEVAAADRAGHDLWALRQRALAIYLLVRQGRNAGNLLGALQEQLERDQPKAWRDDATGLLVAASYARLQQDKPARQLAARALARANRAPAPAFDYAHFYDPGIDQAWTLYLLNKHFPALARQLAPAALDRLFAPLRDGSYNTLSSGLTVLALDAQAGVAGNPPPPTLQAAPADGPARQIGRVTGIVASGAFRGSDARLWVTPATAAPAWYALTQNGYDRGALPAVQSQGLEVIREYLDDAGKPVSALALGQEVTVRVRVRASRALGDVAITDLLPGGFEAVLQQAPPTAPVVDDAGDDAADAGEAGDGEGDGEGEGDEGGVEGAAPAPAMPSLALPGSSFLASHVEVREDRVVLYGWASPGVTEFRYRIRANNAGRFVVPPILGESLYARRVYARGPAGGALLVGAPGEAAERGGVHFFRVLR
jgi:uncharacterized protein YfaS (alpha-2-macroglobulin family)